MERSLVSWRPQLNAVVGLMVMVMMVVSQTAIAMRRSERCSSPRSLGNKWFDGCQWCVCTVRGKQCSRTGCSSLVKKVPPCHVPGQTWTDGCYRCLCKKDGIACKLDVTCLLLRHHPVPCLADDRCICGPDGVPSCTAEVIDRHAFAARRFELGIPDILAEEVPQDGGSRSVVGQRYGHAKNRRHHRNQRHYDSVMEPASSLMNDQPMASSPSSSSPQELLIMSDNLCRFGPRWYGGSLRCFCDIDGSITCGNPIFVSAFFDDFKVERKECEEGHAWEEGCSICSCRLNGVVFCRHNRQCRLQPFNRLSEEDEEEEEDDRNDSRDHYLPVLPESPRSESGVSTIRTSPSRAKSTSRTPHSECVKGAQWRQGCERCRCNERGRIVCSRRHCSDDRTGGRSNSGHGRHKTHHHTPKHGNRAKERTVTMKPKLNRAPRGPMMVAPKPVSMFRPPAYSIQSGIVKPKSGCGKFKVGARYWDDCNLCLCTIKGPKCQGKLCR